MTIKVLILAPQAAKAASLSNPFLKNSDYGLVSYVEIFQIGFLVSDWIGNKTNFLLDEIDQAAEKHVLYLSIPKDSLWRIQNDRTKCSIPQQIRKITLSKCISQTIIKIITIISLQTLNYIIGTCILPQVWTSICSFG